MTIVIHTLDTFAQNVDFSPSPARRSSFCRLKPQPSPEDPTMSKKRDSVVA